MIIQGTEQLIFGGKFLQGKKLCATSVRDSRCLETSPAKFGRELPGRSCVFLRLGPPPKWCATIRIERLLATRHVNDKLEGLKMFQAETSS